MQMISMYAFVTLPCELISIISFKFTTKQGLVFGKASRTGCCELMIFSNKVMVYIYKILSLMGFRWSRGGME